MSSSYQSAGGRGNGDFARLSTQIGNNSQRMSQTVTNVERLVRQLGTQQDSEQLRTRLHTMIDENHTVAQQTGELLKNLAIAPVDEFSDARAQKLQRERLLNQFNDVLVRFQDLQREAVRKEKESLSRARTQSSQQQLGGGGTSGQNAWNPFEDDDNRQSQQNQPKTAPISQTALQIEKQVNLEALHERENAIRLLENDIRDVNQIFKDLAVLVHEQGEVIDSIEANVETAHVRVEEATSQLSQARMYRSKSRRKLCCLMLVGMVILVAVIIVLVIELKN